MYLTGFTDEASPDLEGQVRASLELGWLKIEARNINGINIHDLPEAEFDQVAERLQEAGVQVNCFGSAILNWDCHVTDPFEAAVAQARRAIARMQQLGTRLIRIMSYAVLEGRAGSDQMEAERFRRLRILTDMFTRAGLTPVHENCMNYGGMSWRHSLRLLEQVPGLRLVFDTGNPVSSPDWSKPEPRPRQSSWEFYRHVREHIAYVHIKDGTWDEAEQSMTYTYPGEGQGDVRRILADLVQRGYAGGLSIEPHLAVVAHDPSVSAAAEARYRSYIEYGRRLEGILAGLGVTPFV